MTADSEPKPWQRGYDLGYLQELEDRFANYNSYSCSPFSEMNKPSLADALNDKRLHVTEWGIVEHSTVTTAGNMKAYLDVTLARKEIGDKVIDSFAYENPTNMIHYLMESKDPTWVWIWQESEEQRRIVTSAGYEFVGSKITSFAEIRGLYFRDGKDTLFHRPAQQLNPVELIGLHRTPINVDVSTAVRELNALAVDFTDHYSNYAGSGGKRGKKAWSALSLRGYTADPAFITKPSEMSKKWRAEHAPPDLQLGFDDAVDEEIATAEVFKMQDTSLRTLLPAIDALHAQLTSIATPHRIRLMRLTPGGGELRRHTDLVDEDSGISDGKVARFHIPIITNDQVLFNSWDMHGVCHEVNMKVGECWYLDTRKPHRAINGGTTERTHLVIDVEANDLVRALLT